MDSLPLYATGTTSFEVDLGWHETYFDDVLDVGIRAIKVRLGNDPDRDLELIARTRRAIGDDCLLMADGYWTYTLRGAIRLARRMEPYDVSFYEEPLPQYMIEALAELRAGMVRDPQFGPCVMFGLGGIFTEVLDDVIFRIAPLRERDALAMMDGIRGSAILVPVRGTAAADRSVLSRTLITLGQIGLENDRIEAIDVNPLLLQDDGLPVAVDAAIWITE